MRGLPTLVAALVLANTASAQEPLPDYGTCLAEAAAEFETALEGREANGARADFAVVGRNSTIHCGMLAVVTCERSADPLGCQADLATRQGDLRAQILASLPAPDAVAGLRGGWSDRLYPQLRAVAQGSSAGPDCAGGDPVYTAWCVTWQANLKLAEAVMLWQVARVLGAADPIDPSLWRMVEHRP